MSGGGGTRPLRRPVRCEDCANGLRAVGRCRLAPLSPWPAVKPIGCLYYRERGGAREAAPEERGEDK